MDSNLGGWLDRLREERDDEASKKLRTDFDRYKREVLSQVAPACPQDVCDWIRKIFDDRGGLDSTDDDLSILMEHLTFTAQPMTAEIRLAWGTYQDEHPELNPFTVDEYPVLEAMAHWYFFHAYDPGHDSYGMFARAAALFEYLMQALITVGAESYENALAGIGLAVAATYIVIEEWDRARFVVQLLENEYFAGRLEDEDYVSLMRLSERTFVGQRGELRSSEKELYKINQVCWDTISKRDRDIEALSDVQARLQEELAKAKVNPNLQEAEATFAQALGVIWSRLHPETRRHLVLAEAIRRSPAASQVPGVIPSAICLAVKTELLYRLLQPRGVLDEAFLKRMADGNPIVLLVKRTETLEDTRDRQKLNQATQRLFGSLHLWRRHVVQLGQILSHRNRAQHPEGGKPYAKNDAQAFQKTILDSGWLLQFLEHLRG